MPRGSSEGIAARTEGEEAAARTAWRRASAAEKQEGIHAHNNREFEVLHKASYQLSEAGDTADAFDEDFQLTTVDMTAVMAAEDDAGAAGDAARADFARRLGEALKEVGFAVLVGHGVPLSLHRAAHDRTARLFLDVPQEVKQRFRAERYGAVNQGWFPREETSNLHPDQVEGWVWTRRAFRLPGSGRAVGAEAEAIAELWPATPAGGGRDDGGEEHFWRQLVLAHERLAPPIFRAMLEFVGADPSVLLPLLQREPPFALRLNYYPPPSNEAVAAAMRGGAGRMVGHEDVDLFTLLPAPSASGLQVRHPRSGRWLRVQAPEGSIVLNTGDYAQLLFNDVFPSTTHRVSAPTPVSPPPPPPTPEQRRRQRRQPGSSPHSPPAPPAPSPAAARTSFPMAIYLPEHWTLAPLPECGAPRYHPVKVLDFHTATNRKYLLRHITIMTRSLD
jgi:isopenicillin N synthase-like dioxygenase